VYIVALRDIAQGEELLYDYALTIDDEITPELKAQYACLCGAERCRGTMLALPDPATDDTPSVNASASDKKQAKQLCKLKKRLRRLEKKIDKVLTLLETDTHA